MVEGVVNGAIDAIATDHAPHAGSEKMQEFEKCPFGIIGLETALGIALEHLVHSGKISITRLIEMFTVESGADLKHPARDARAPALPPMSRFSPRTAQWTYDVNKSFSKSRNSPFDGVTFRGGPVATIVSGKIVWQV